MSRRKILSLACAIQPWRFQNLITLRGTIILRCERLTSLASHLFSVRCAVFVGLGRVRWPEQRFGTRPCFEMVGVTGGPVCDGCFVVWMQRVDLKDRSHGRTRVQRAHRRVLDDAAPDPEPSGSGRRNCGSGARVRHRASAESGRLADCHRRCFHHRLGLDRSVLQYPPRVLHASAGSAGVLCDRFVCDGFCDLFEALASPSCIGQALLQSPDYYHSSEDPERRDVRGRLRSDCCVDPGHLRELLRFERLLRRYRDDSHDERQGGEGGGETGCPKRGFQSVSAGGADEGEVRKVDGQGARRCR